VEKLVAGEREQKQQNGSSPLAVHRDYQPPLIVDSGTWSAAIGEVGRHGEQVDQLSEANCTSFFSEARDTPYDPPQATKPQEPPGMISPMGTKHKTVAVKQRVIWTRD
jgi:hypothetical protein